MPIIAVERTSFLKAIERELSDEGVDALLADFGLELDEIEEEEEKDETTGEIVEKTIYKVEIPANRYDLLCVEGLTMALRVYLGIDQTPNFQVVPPEGELETMFVRPSTSPLRPFVVCSSTPIDMGTASPWGFSTHASIPPYLWSPFLLPSIHLFFSFSQVSAIIRDMTFEPETYDSFIELQEKLHQNICRKRTLVAIGTHDLGSSFLSFLSSLVLSFRHHPGTLLLRLCGARVLLLRAPHRFRRRARLHDRPRAAGRLPNEPQPQAPEALHRHYLRRA